MENTDLIELLDSVNKFKSNIKECDAILKTLKEIRDNYDNAVTQPKQILKKLDALAQKFSALIQDYNKLQAECNRLNLETLNACNLKITETVEYCRTEFGIISEKYEKLIISLKDATKNLSDTIAVQDGINKLMRIIDKKVDETNNMTKTNKKLLIVCIVVSGIAVMLGIINLFI